MIRFRSILVMLMLLVPAAKLAAISPSGTLDGGGSEKVPGIIERSPASAPIPIDAGSRAIEGIEIPADLGNFDPYTVVDDIASHKAADQDLNDGFAKSELQHKRDLRKDRVAKKEFRTQVRNIKLDLKKALVKERIDRKDNNNSGDTQLLLLVILAILLPPLAVYLYDGSVTINFWISLILTLLFWLPGIIFALIYILGGF